MLIKRALLFYHHNRSLYVILGGARRRSFWVPTFDFHLYGQASAQHDIEK